VFNTLPFRLLWNVGGEFACLASKEGPPLEYFDITVLAVERILFWGNGELD
jgi:hypothetical protein